MNNVLKKNLLLLSLLCTTGFVVSCGSIPNSSSLPNSEFSSGSTSENDSWIWWDDVEGDEGDKDDDDDEPAKQYNTIDYLKDYMSYFYSVDCSLTKTFDHLGGAQRYESELCAELTGDAIIEDETHAGYLQDGATVTFKITSSAACNVALIGSLSAHPSMTDGLWFDSQFSLKVNNEDIDTGDCWILPTPKWDSFKINPIAAIKLVEGENIIEFTGFLGNSNIDYISLSPEKKDLGVVTPEFTYSKNLKIEAEDCLLYDCKIEEGANLSNGKNIGFTTAYTILEFSVNSTEATKTSLNINSNICVSDLYSGKISDRFTLYVNGKYVNVSQEVLPDTDESEERWWLQDYFDVNIADFDLKEGKNHIAFQLSKELNLDYLVLR